MPWSLRRLHGRTAWQDEFVCDRDMVTPLGPAVKAAHKAPHGELRQYAGTHFDIYVGELFEKAVADQTAFLTRWVLNVHSSMESRASM